MPDQSSAADEHALLAEIAAPLSSLPEDPVTVAGNVEFPIVLRGYDRLAVDAYVRQTSQLVAELQATRSPEAAVRRALERVGEEVSGVLQRAHDTSDEITTQSRREAEDRLELARRESEQITAEAHRRVQELDAETDRIWSERQRIVEDARQLAQDLLVLAEAAGQRFPAASEDEPGQATDPREEPTVEGPPRPAPTVEGPPRPAPAQDAGFFNVEDSQPTMQFDPAGTAPFDPSVEADAPDVPEPAPEPPDPSGAPPRT